MKKLLLLSIVLILGLAKAQTASASHFAGSDLTYTCLGGNTYLISLSFYRDCSGISAPGSTPVQFSCSSNGQFNFSATLNKIPGTGQEVTPGCSAIPTRCNGGYNYGIREYVYQAQVTLVPCNSWTMSYSSCCRNPITTLQSSGGWYIMAKLNNLSAPCNSSPTFSNKPIAVACNGQTSCFNHGALDPNGDSLVYSFFAPKTSASATVNYLAGYSYTNFLNSSTPITIDPLTGDICFTPTSNLVTVTGVKVQEWRTISGVPTLIGTVYRDIQLKVDYCNNTIPILSGMDTLNTHTYNPNDTTYAIEMCLGPSVSFDINGFDADSFSIANTGHPEVFHISWNQGIPQGTFTSHYNGTDSAYAHFSWTPTSADVSNVPKCFTATVHDEACPYYGSQTFSYCITVRGMLVDIGTDTLLCTGDTLTIFADADTTTVNYVWKWDGQPTSTPQSSKKYFINTSSYPPGIDTLSIETNDGSTTMACPGRDYIIVNHTLQPHIQGTLPDSAFCEGNSVIYDAGPGTTYLWMTIPNNPIGASRTLKIDTTNVYTVFVDGGVNTRCVDQDTFLVASVINPVLGNDTCYWLDDAPIELTAGYFPGISYLWSTGATTDSIQVNQSGNYKISFFDASVNSNVKCSDDVNINIIDRSTFITSAMVNALDDNTSESPLAGDRTICTHQRLKILGPEPPTGVSYDYQWSKNGTPGSTAQYFILKESEEGDYTIVLNAGGCVDEVTVTAEHCLLVPPNVITPYNVDGFNDVFHIDGLENFPDTKLQIYNRWGKKIYESNNYQNDWNGNGAADGVYYWVLYVADGLGTTMKGTVTIISKK